MSGNSGWIHLLGRHAVDGAGVFDLQIVATMLANGVQRIYTFNPGDFQVFAEFPDTLFPRVATTSHSMSRLAQGEALCCVEPE